MALVPGVKIFQRGLCCSDAPTVQVQAGKAKRPGYRNRKNAKRQYFVLVTELFISTLIYLFLREFIHTDYTFLSGNITIITPVQFNRIIAVSGESCGS